MKTAHDVLREEKQKQQVRIVSEEELEKLEITPLTTKVLFEELAPFVPVIVDFPDGSERVVTVRRFNNAEAFAGLGVYAFIQDDGKIDEKSMTKDEKIELDIKIKRQSVVLGIVDSETNTQMFKQSGTDGDGYPVESLGSAYLNIFFDAVNAVNNPEEVQEFLRGFRETDKDGTGTTSDVDAGEEGSTVSPTTESDGSASVPDNDVPAPGNGD